MYRILRDTTSARTPPPATHPAHKKTRVIATRRTEVWSWDITKLMDRRSGLLLLVCDLGHLGAATSSAGCSPGLTAELAKMLIAESIERQGVRRDQLTLHSEPRLAHDREARAHLLADLGVTSHAAPARLERHPTQNRKFRTFKYRPDFPRARQLRGRRAHCGRFSVGTRGPPSLRHCLHTPADVHYGRAEAISSHRGVVLLDAYAEHPERFVADLPHLRSFRRWRGSTNEGGTHRLIKSVRNPSQKG